jgi:hypothetical protein
MSSWTAWAPPWHRQSEGSSQARPTSQLRYGGVILAEDGDGTNHLVGAPPSGEAFATSVTTNAE